MNVMVQLIMFPVSIEASSCTKSCQIPFAVHPLRTLKDCSGEKFPVNGAVPAFIDVAADGVKQVFV